jgi:cation diffusion facilitator family transporter
MPSSPPHPDAPRDRPEPQPQPQHAVRAAVERTAALGIAVNAALALAKLVAGILGNSFALVADAVESLVDLAGSFVVWGALRYGRRPADDDHPFGHGKIEALAALSVGLLVISAGVGIGAAAASGLGQAQETPAGFTLIVLLTVVAIKETMFRLTRRSAHQAASSLGHADAWHHRADAITSLVAFVGIVIALAGGSDWAAADEVAALVASGIIVINGVRLMREPFADLMDAHAPEVAEAVCIAALEVDGVRDIERCETRRSGRGYRVVLHAEVDPEMTVAASHRITGILKERIRIRHPEVDSVLVHIEPHDPRDAAPDDG